MAVWSKGHFNLIANVIKESDLDEKERSKIAVLFAAFLANENPRFDKTRFVSACWKEEKNEK